MANRTLVQAKPDVVDGRYSVEVVHIFDIPAPAIRTLDGAPLWNWRALSPPAQRVLTQAERDGIDAGTVGYNRFSTTRMAGMTDAQYKSILDADFAATVPALVARSRDAAGEAGDFEIKKYKFPQPNPFGP